MIVLAQLQALHIHALAKVIGQIIIDDLRFIYGIADGRELSISQKEALPTGDVIKVNRYWNRYQDSFRGADSDSLTAS